MLELVNLTQTIKKDGQQRDLIHRVSCRIPQGHFVAVVGLSGCGKTSLIKLIAGISQETEGSLHWQGRDLAEESDFEPQEIGYVPQFSICYEKLTVDEVVLDSASLRVGYPNTAARNEAVDKVLAEVGLSELMDRQVQVLSGGQKRRLGLAMELISEPELLLCDEVTSGLDPDSEKEIVELLHSLSRNDNRTILSVTHSLAHLDFYDSIIVLHEGRIVYHGKPEHLAHFFSVAENELVYQKLANSQSEELASVWDDVSVSYAFEEKEISDGDRKANKLPNWFTQFYTLMHRRWQLFLRDRGQFFVQLAIILCFPILVALFHERAKEPIRQYSETRQSSLIDEIKERQMVRGDQLKVGSAISGIIMFQVVLLSLMGSNNSAREVAGERLIFEKEKFAGVRPSAYLCSKIVFLSVLVVLQSLWMAGFVEYFSPFRGDFLQHFLFLLLANAAMTAVCLAISSLMKTAEQASLLSIYLVGFQLPLSGAVLALPQSIEAITRPFISAYWGWSGSVSVLQPNAHYAVKSIVETTLSAQNVCLIALILHIIGGIILAWMGVRHNQWK